MKGRYLGFVLGVLLVAIAAALVVYGNIGGLMSSKTASQQPAGAASTQTMVPAGTAPASTGQSAGNDIQPGFFQKLTPAPDLAGVVVTDAEGKNVDLGSYKGKALLINVWATWCPPCVAEMPSLDRLQAQLGSDNFAVVPVAVDENSLDKVKQFLADHQLDKLPALLDANHALDGVVKIAALPTSLLVSPEGKILARFTGENKWDCGKALAAVQNFAKDGAITEEMLEPCPN
ncbi:TlpA disulfide reductase family protein [Dongia soli]|uniref:TlpA disulfide reductase family protein n=1 Tax=Dongia soli TaxID=600628 RepID=A0ABU5E4Q2_9PROT|nr:TlpA disulfide reductase family protein [Dongia soli]MDY0881247.1 TlpA disulfide reductase family protein [Dongia soli]